jgi:prepilin-type N-terminal cleavage/methylation domain-containing protein
MRARDRSFSTPLLDRGFTLIEMLVLLAIVALAISVVPTMLGGLPGARLRAAADAMAGTLRELHSEAISRRTTMELIVDPAARAYRITSEADGRVLPDVVAQVDVRKEAALPSQGLPRIRFLPMARQPAERFHSGTRPASRQSRSTG